MADDFAKEVRELREQALKADETNRNEALSDLKFAAGEHWDPEIKAFREEMGRKLYGFPLPCLTIHTVTQLIGQVIGDRRANATSIKVLPREDGDKKVAEVRSELIRSIELQSKADRVFTQTFDNAVTCGIGNFRIDLDYAYEDAFDRDLFIRGIPNPLAVIWDPLAGDPTGRDASYCFVADRITKEDFKKRFPQAKEPSGSDLREMTEGGWIDEDTVELSEYWKIEERPRTFAMMLDGSIQDVTEQDKGLWLPNVAIGPNGQPVIRENAMCKYAVRELTNGLEPLEEKFELKLHRLPIIRCMGREVWVGDKRVRFGLTRWARDPAQLKDYMRSVRAELLMLATRANYTATVSAVKGREADWRNCLIYNDGAPEPKEVTGSNLASLMAEEQMFAQDMKDVTGIHDASLGVRSNETSGVAIQRRQAEGDIATIIYHDNMNHAQQEAGEVLNALIPIVYDTARTIRTVGADEAVKLVKVNDPNNPDAIDLSTGRYDVTVTTGPSYATRRVESASQLMELASRAPQIAQAAGDLIIGEMDLVKGDQIAERVKRTIPAQILGDDADEDNDPQAIQQKQQQQQKEQIVEMLQLRKLKAEAEKAEAEATAAKRKIDIDQQNADTQRLKVVQPVALPPESVAVLAPQLTQAIMSVLGGGMLPPELHQEIAHSAFDDAANSRANDLEDEAARAEIARQNAPDRPGAEL